MININARYFLQCGVRYAIQSFKYVILEFKILFTHCTRYLLVNIYKVLPLYFTLLRYSVRFVVEHHTLVEVLPEFNCTIPAAVPVADVPVPYSVDTEIYANLSTINVSLTVNLSSIDTNINVLAKFF